MKNLSVLPIVPLMILALAGCDHHNDYASHPEKNPTSEKATPAPGTAPDNTGVNVRDRNNNTLTPMDQGESEADRTLTQRVRKAIVADDSLSITAQNVKIITANGMVTLRGPVNTEQEKNAIHAKAVQIAGVERVNDQLEITQ